jgi:hypothetical protein
MPLADFNADLDEIQGDFPSTLIVGTRLIPCVKSSLTHEVTYDETGYFLPETWEVVASRRDFADVPEPRHNGGRLASQQRLLEQRIRALEIIGGV